MDIASYIANSQTTPASAELGTAQLQLVPFIIPLPLYFCCQAFSQGQLPPSLVRNCIYPDKGVKSLKANFMVKFSFTHWSAFCLCCKLGWYLVFCHIIIIIIKSITVQNCCTADHNFGSRGSSLLFCFLCFESLFVLFLSYLFQIFSILWLVLLCFRWKSDYKK